MEYIVTGSQMKLLDNATSELFGVPAVVLMEQAAEGVVRELVASVDKNKKIAVICGKGNNGGDGIAIARLLRQRGYNAAIYMAGKSRENESTLCRLQRKIYENYEFPIIYDKENIFNYDIVVDALFGTGLKRNVTGEYAELINMLNDIDAFKLAIDIPSGIDADTAKVLGIAFKADVTYTFSYKKLGQLLSPGYSYTGEIIVVKIGIDDKSFRTTSPVFFALNETDIQSLPKRIPDSNKGTYGKLLIVAGSYNMAGAAVFSAKAAYKSGVGMVKVISDERNRDIIQNLVPEALLGAYDNIESDIAWADAVVIGPGLGKSSIAKKVLQQVIITSKCPVIIDADALNIISENKDILRNHKQPVIVTPHLGEMSRLTGDEITKIKENIIQSARDFSKEFNVICVLKDFRTVVVEDDKMVYINLSGNSGMATAGSGDILSGIIGALAAQGNELKKAAEYAVFIHGLAADKVFNKTGSYGMIASDIVSGLDNIWNKVK